MIKRILKSMCVAILITSMIGVTAFADEVTDLKNEQSEVLSQLEGTEKELARIVLELDELELQMADKNEELEKTNKQLVSAEATMAEQYADMKLRIKYMYEDQNSSISEVILASDNMSDMLNKAEYVQQVYAYDRNKMDEMAATANTIKDLKRNIEKDLEKIAEMGEELTSKKASLTATMAKLEKESADYETKIANAIAKAAEEAAKKQNNNKAPTFQANNNSAIATAIVSDSFKYLGVKYVYGGSTPSGFDCSGFTQYLFKQYGITLARSAAGQLGSGSKVASLAEAQPGDIICYPGHVGLYIGNNQVIHAPYTGQVVRVQDVNMMTIIGIRRYW